MSTELRVMVLDDEASIRFSLRELLRREGYRVEECADPQVALRVAEDFRPQVVISDYSLPHMDGLQFMETLLSSHPDTLVIFMTAYGTEEVAVEAMKRGAHDYFKKPFKNDAVLVSVAKARQRVELLAENQRLREQARRSGDGAREFIGEAPAVREMFALAERVAATNVTVLIQGESGTGKELVASYLHHRSSRAHQPFVRLNCAAIPEGLVESELFGYQAGAFSGANEDRKGKFEQADGGTIFLDEIGDMPEAVQTKVLRVLQEREIERLGGGKPRRVDVRILAATHQDLQALVASGRFREDLYYRLNVVSLRLPALRDRLEDLPLLVDHLQGLYVERFGVSAPAFGDEDLERFQGHSWPGNVRELENAVARAVLQGSFESVALEGDAAPPAATRRADSTSPAAPGSAGPGASWADVDLDASYKEAKRELIEGFERAYLGRMLERAGGNVSKAARLSGMHRKNFYEKMQRLGLDDAGERGE